MWPSSKHSYSGLMLFSSIRLPKARMVGMVLSKISSPKLRGAAVQSGHLGEQLSGLQTLLRGHTGSAAGGGDHDDIGQLLADGVHHHTEALTALSGRAIVLTDMDVQDGCTGLVGGLGLTDHLLHGVGTAGCFLGDLRAADGCVMISFSITRLLENNTTSPVKIWDPPRRDSAS